MSDTAYSDSAVLTIDGGVGSSLLWLPDSLNESGGDVFYWLVDTADRFSDSSPQLGCNMTKKFQLPPVRPR